VYSDYRKDLKASPVNNDLARRTDDDSIKESIRNLILTDRGERLFNPEIGSDIRGMLFENITPDLVVVLRENIRNTLENYEPRCNVIEIVVDTSVDSNSVFVRIIFNTINTEEPSTLDLLLDRVR
jgi:phage baseplate assembly protein W